MTFSKRQARLAVEVAEQWQRRRLGRAGSAFSTVNRAQFQAQKYETDMIEVLAALAMDATQPGALRRDCAKDVVEIARGRPANWYHDGQTIDPQARLEGGETIEAGMAEVDAEVDFAKELDRLARERVPYERWPERVRNAVGEVAALFDDEQPALPGN